MGGNQQCSQCLVTDFCTMESVPRRSANYKPNIWKNNLVESLHSEFIEERYESEATKLKTEVIGIFDDTSDLLDKLQFIDIIGKLGLAYLFKAQIMEGLDTILSTKNKNSSIKEDLYATSLCFRLLRQHDCNVSQEMFKGFLDDSGKLKNSMQSDVKGMLELFEASNLAMEGENILEEARVFTTGILRSIRSNVDGKLASQVAYTLESPVQRTVDWYEVKRHIQDYEKQEAKNIFILKLAKLNFNVIQATHQNDLRDMLRWWQNLGISESLSFTRNRIVESYLWSVGVVFEPWHGNLRKWLTKVIKLVLIVDDVYDVYGSLQELELFTSAVNRWDFDGIQKLPDCMKICFRTLVDTTNEIAFEIQREKNWNSVLPRLREVWEDFCNALLVEARWDKEGYTPSLQEYLNNGWISSSGPVLSLHAILSVTLGKEEEITAFWKNNQDLVYHTSLIIRLCNDQATSKAELERGDAPSSILCFMREANVSVEIAQNQIRSIINRTWKKINTQYCTAQTPVLKSFMQCTTNIARVAHFIYKNGDGFGVQDGETRDQVLALLIEPYTLD